MVSLREDLWALTIRLSPWKDWWFPCKYWKVSTFRALVLSFFWPSLGMCPLCHLKNLKISLTSPQVRISTQQLVRGIPPCFPGRWTSQPEMWSFLPLYFYCWHKYKCPVSPTSSKPPPPSPGRHHTLSVSMGHAYMFFHWSLLILLSSPLLPVPLWQLSVCSMCPWLCFYFVRQFILFIRFHI